MRYGPNSYYTLGQMLREGLRIPWKRRVRRSLDWLGFTTPAAFIGPRLMSFQVTQSSTSSIQITESNAVSVQSYSV